MDELVNNEIQENEVVNNEMATTDIMDSEIENNGDNDELLDQNSDQVSDQVEPETETEPETEHEPFEPIPEFHDYQLTPDDIAKGYKLLPNFDDIVDDGTVEKDYAIFKGGEVITTSCLGNSLKQRQRYFMPAMKFARIKVIGAIIRAVIWFAVSGCPDIPTLNICHCLRRLTNRPVKVVIAWTNGVVLLRHKN